tara:strand:+ start:17 stop:1171 length:1155 start_codon:yes stop_codon:yes gene_type:complete
MKFIGQYIQDFIARFRSDVYLEDVSSGTIASGGNLGLDSNNKIVKATISSTTDLASDVTGTLPVANGGTGATTLTSNSILTGNGTSAVQAESGLTYDSEALDVGDDDDGAAQIRRLRHTDEAGGDLYIRGGDATGTNKAGGDLQLFGGRATGNANGGSIILQTGALGESSGTTLRGTSTIASFRGSDKKTLLTGNLIFEGPVVDGNDTEFSITEQTANRTITIPDASGTIAFLDSDITGTATNATKQIFVTTHNFQLNNNTSIKNYVPFNNLNESTSGGPMNNYWTRTLAPYPGTIKKIAVRSQTSLGSSCELRISKITDTTDKLEDGTHVDNTGIDLSTAQTTVITTMNTNSFAAGDAVGVALQRSAGTAAQVIVTIVWEYTT